MYKCTSTKYSLYLLILFFLSCLISGCNGRSGKECEKISPPDIQDVLKKINMKNANITYIKNSPLTGVCEVAIEKEGRPQIFYLDAEKNYLIFGKLVEMKTMTSLTDKSAREILDKKRIDTSQISLNAALVLGDPKAAKKIIIFTDPECPYCGNLHKTMKQIIEKRKDIAFYIKMYPLEFHKDAYWKSRSIVCNNSLQLLEDCFNKKEISKTECPTEEIDNNLKLAKSLGITGTPAIIFPDGKMRMGALPEAELIKLIDGKK